MVIRKLYWFLIFTSLLLSGCFEVSESILFEDYKPQLVIEGLVDSDAPPYFIKVSQSAPPDGDEDFFPVNNARIIMSSSLQEEEIARWVSPGTYEVGSFTGKPGAQYNLLVQIDDKQYIAQEYMPSLPAIDSVSIDYRKNYVDGDGYYFKLFIQKKANEVNYYKVDVRVNDSVFNGYDDLLIFDDSYFEDQYTYILPYAFNRNDSIGIVLRRISENMHQYYNGLIRQTTNVFGNIQPPMLNPESNVNYDVLGYFQASAVVKIDTLIVDPDL
ncbi:MAG: hypothetical protein CVU09_17710 [Bacteroidetes bacterium HGW-Bacteroidetes-4]|jgi:hypothetical protein|nr:MAG: hypothetical protein CVU09_17710 [Bacteroidetes bacterium HGW-Bacteroidetes-4]